ncbi:penicillin acylase family protein [Streptomyces swartbergensis]|uniref:penicillin acylase family protein n=1 Tax=Streptomyces swartbergensis TaxID=487165 RepID=UPI0037FABE8F
MWGPPVRMRKTGVRLSRHRGSVGIPHLCASGAARLAFAQGRNVAREGVWQIEVERHRSQGATNFFFVPSGRVLGRTTGFGYRRVRG